MREEIKEILKLGKLPNSQADLDAVNIYESILNKATPPVTDAEAQELVKLFGDDEAFGLAWTLVHLIESSPNWSIEKCPQNTENFWIEVLRSRLENTMKQN